MEPDALAEIDIPATAVEGTVRCAVAARASEHGGFGGSVTDVEADRELALL